MKLTALSCQEHLEEDPVLSCHLLEICQTRVLLECPLDLSVLAIFLPSFQSVQDGATPVSSSSLRFISHVLASKSEQELASSRPTAAAAARTVEQEKTLKDSINNLSTVKSEPVSARAKRPRSEQQSQGPGSATEGKQKRKSHTDVMSASLSFLKENSGQVLIEGEPWYKTAELGLVEVALLDAVVVSNPLGLLGLPFLTKNPDFSAKIYMTEATAKIGQLMMEELVNMHAEFIQVHGRSRDGQLPSWLNVSTLDTLPAILRDSIVGRSLAGRSNWHLLYNKADIRDCMAMVHRLHYGEEANIDGCLKIKPSSSGLGIGASNWTISGARRSVAYIAGSLVTANSVKAFDLPALEGSQILLFGDVEFADESSTSVEEKVTSGDMEVDIRPVVDGLQIDSGVIGVEQPAPARQSSTGSGSSHRLTTATSGSLPSTTACNRSLSSIAIGGSVKPPSVSPVGAPTLSSERGGNRGSGEVSGALRPDTTASDVRPQVAAVCKAAVETVRRGGSVLIPSSPFPILLELLDEMAVQLASVNLTDIPIKYISPAAEEMLAYGNTVPEWLCPSRQEKNGVAGAMHYFCIALEFENGTSCASSSSLEAQPPLLAYPH
ncbi:hypothetical protein BDL97_10G109700 [Sphagnum fallax]|nr:hypothetical protein BDL97_10G109700 [Sphagnum fallax]